MIHPECPGRHGCNAYAACLQNLTGTCQRSSISLAQQIGRLNRLMQEFAEFAHGRDVSERAPGRTPLELPYAIDGDKVGGQSIKYMLNKVCTVGKPHHATSISRKQYFPRL